MAKISKTGFLCVVAVLAIGPARAQTYNEVVLHNFSRPKGSRPYADLTRDSGGNLYGTTVQGGTANVGVVYKLDTAHRYTVLYNFRGGTDGASPRAGVMRDSEGNLYGTTLNGGMGGMGVVYELDTSGQETVLYSFSGGVDGGAPWAGVIRDPAGNLYGTTFQGGTANVGVVYELDTSGQETVLYSFSGGADGGFPYAGVSRDSAGNLYGTTFQGGTANFGVIYKLDRAGQETVLYSFSGGADGGFPYASVIRDSAGNLYGTTVRGGTGNVGVVYKLDPAGNYTVLHSFTGGADGAGPYAGLIRDSAGNLYGTTDNGGIAGGGGRAGFGVVYEVDVAGQETVLYRFAGGAGGSFPYGGVVRNSVGNFYGTVYNGGHSGGGVLFELKPQ